MSVKISQRGAEFSLTLLLCAVFYHYATLPLWPTDLWDHVNYGRWILQHQQLPETEPLVPLAADEPMAHSAWAGQVVMAAVTDRPHGTVLLQWLHAVLITLAAALPAVAVRRKCRLPSQVVGAIATVSTFVALGWHQNAVVRPQTAGIVFYCWMVARLTTSPTRTSRRSLMLLALMFSAWSNLHGSFAVGLTFLALFGAGQCVDLWCRGVTPRKLLLSAAARTTLLRLLVAIAGSCCNPHGVFIFEVVLEVGRHPNIPSMVEWQPLTATPRQSLTFAIVAVLLSALLLLTPRRRRWNLILPLLFFAGFTILSSRMINWLAPVAAVLIGLHIAAIVRRWLVRRRRFVEATRLPVFTWITAIGLSCVVITQLSRLWHDQTQDVLAEFTPVAAADALRQSPPEGLAFAPAEWAGYLQYRVPGFKPMVNLHVHLMPPNAWSDFLQLARGRHNLLPLLDRYDIRAVVADRRRNGPLIDALRASSSWRQIHVDRQARIFVPVDGRKPSGVDE